jgi:hypothetical protein
MRRWVLLLFGLALFLSAAAPAIEPLDRWDRAPSLMTDTEFRVGAFALGIGLAILALVAADSLLRAARSQATFIPSLVIFDSASRLSAALPRSNSPPIPIPLRI